MKSILLYFVFLKYNFSLLNLLILNLILREKDRFEPSNEESIINVINSRYFNFLIFK